MNSWILQNGMTLLAISGYFFAGILVFLGYFGMGTRERRKDSEELADTLINRLKQTVEQQEITMTQMNVRLEQTTKELHLMQGRNSVLEGLFNGDENSIRAFIKQAPKLLEVSQENNNYSKANNQALNSLTKAIEEFINRLPPFMPSLQS